MKVILWLFVFLVILSESCTLPSEATKRIPFDAIPVPNLWTVGDQPAYMVVNEKNWPTYYSNPPSGSDFRSFIYVVVSSGMKPNAGYTVNIRQVERAKEIITVRVELIEPDPRKIYAQVIVHPTAVAQIAKAELEPGGMLDFIFIDQKGTQLAAYRTQI